MHELAPRLPCPVCLGTRMDKISVGPGSLVVDHCGRCGGLWFERGEVQELRARAPDELWARIGKRREGSPMRCHECQATMSREDDRCGDCGRANLLDCPACHRPMQLTSHSGLKLDICRDCKGAFFDHHELSAIWSASFDKARKRRAGSGGSTAAELVGEGAIEALFYAPELVYHAARGTAQGLAASADMAAEAPEAGAAALEAVGEAAGTVLEFIGEVVGGIFDGL